MPVKDFLNHKLSLLSVKLYAAFILYGLAILSVSRLVLVIIFSDHLHDIQDIARVFIQGMRVDLATLSLLAILPYMFHSAYVSALPDSPTIEKLSRSLLILLLSALVLLELTTPFYIHEYGERPERKFFEYLTDPKEVMYMLWGMYSYLLLLIPLVAFGCIKIFTYLFNFSQDKLYMPRRNFFALFPLLLLLLLFSARSSLDHRPLNPSMVAFSNDPLTNNLPLNSFYSLGYSIYNLKHESDSSFAYGKLDRQKVLDKMESIKKQNQTVSELETFADTQNIVIILEESLGACFVGQLNKHRSEQSLTPELDKLSEQGWWFTQMYATGTRSVRGIEAVVTGFLPTPSRSVVKLGKSQKDFYTLANTLSQNSYTNRFYYGGFAHFDNMKGFFLGNGFDEVIEQNDFNEAQYFGSWGASDGDVFNRIHQDLLNNRQTKNFSLVLTTSNHTPFDFPEIPELIQGDIKTRENAIRYADYALGKFIEQAKQSAYWQNTIILVVADHDLRASDFQNGETISEHPEVDKVFPIDGFHIPALILGGKIKPRIINTRSSQIDLPVTLLSLAAIADETPMIGRNLNSSDIFSDRAIMQYNETQAFWKDEELVELRPNKKPLTFELKNDAYTKIKDKELNKLALSHALWPSIQYQEGFYKMP